MSRCALAPMQRREALKRGSVLLALAACGLSAATVAAAAEEEAAFNAPSLPEALAALGGTPATRAEIRLDIPDLVENGAFVPVTVESRLAGTREIFIVVESNPNPLVARFTIPDGTEPFIATRIKMAESCNVYAVVRAGGRLYSAFHSTQVMVGGCG